MWLYLSDNHFTGHISSISSYSLEYLYLDGNKLQGNIPTSIFDLVNLTILGLSSNNFSGPFHFPLFSKLQNLEQIGLSQNNQLSLNFTSNVNYSFSSLSFLDLSSMCLTEFPNLSKRFPKLADLDLSNNKLDEKIPNWLEEMSSMQFLNLSQNLLTGSLDQFSRNSQLQDLDLSFNLLDGVFSSTICNLTSLDFLILSHNKLTGTIPQCLANLYLSVLDAQINKIYGTLPITFPKGLNILNLNDNQLEGSLPESLSNCTNLELLNLGNNQIEDTFPHWLQTLPSLKVLVLQVNKLHGPITSLKTKHPFPSLIIFDISSNNFNGSIPKAFIKNFQAMKSVIQVEAGSYEHFFAESFGYTNSMTIAIKANAFLYTKIPMNFVNIDLSRNKFEGEIPNAIGELQRLKGNLSHNKLSGPVPKSMRNLTRLESLDLSSNMLTGEIPAELTNLNFLEVLNLSGNQLVGEIPRGQQFDTFSNDSYEGNLGLCGPPLSTKCRNDPEQSSPAPPSMDSEEELGFGWKAVAVGYGCGMVFGMGIGCCVLLIGKPQWLVRMFGGQIKLNKRVNRMKTP